jgi:hypothetical protein
MKIKTRTVTGLIPFVMLISSSLVQAEENSAAELDNDRGGQKWQSFSDEMSPSEYKRVVRANQKQVRNFVKSYSSEALASAGVPEAGVALLGAAAGLAVDGDARVHLNESKTFAFQFDNVVDDERALLFTFKKNW